jgi:hypothetical protein
MDGRRTPRFWELREREAGEHRELMKRYLEETPAARKSSGKD